MGKLLQRFTIVAILVAVNIQVNGQAVVTHIDDISGEQQQAGIIYNLPRTVLKVDLTVTKVSEFRGPFALYSPNLLGIENVIMENDFYYTVDDIKITSFTEPDPEQFYLVNLPEKSDREFWLKAGASGMLSGHFRDEDEAGEAWQSESFEKGIPGDLFPGYTRTAKIEKTDTIRRIVTIDTTTIEKYVLRRFLEEKTEEDKAREAAEMINRLKEDKYKLLVGYQETAYDEGAMEFMYGKLDEMERSYLRLFTGITRKETLSKSFFLIPDPEDMGEQVPLTSWSEDEGFLTQDKDEKIFLQFGSDVEKPGKGASAIENPGGIVYRVSVPVSISVIYDENILQTSRMNINQFGSLRTLPRGVKDFSINTSTGNIEMVRIQPQ